MKRRTEDFKLVPGKLPDVTKAGWGALRDFYRAVRVQQRDCGKAFAALQENGDLTAEARQRYGAKIRKEMKETIEPLWEALLAAREKMASEIEAIVDGEANIDPLAPPKIRFSVLSAAETELARVGLYQHEQTARVARLLVDGRVDEMISRALARDTDKSGAPLFAQYEALLSEGDPLVLQAFERAAPQRLRVEGSAAVAKALSEMAEGSRAARLPEEAKALLDHRDKLDEDVAYTEGVLGETRTDEFLFGRSLALDLAGQSIGWVATEEGE